MRVGVLILDRRDRYVYDDGSLPVRPTFDKPFLLGLLAGEKRVMASPNTIESLPKSVLNLVEVTEPQFVHSTRVNLGIKTMYTHTPDLLFITRSNSLRSLLKSGKKFDLSYWRPILKLKEFEIWKRC